MEQIVREARSAPHPAPLATETEGTLAPAAKRPALPHRLKEAARLRLRAWRKRRRVRTARANARNGVLTVARPGSLVFAPVRRWVARMGGRVDLAALPLDKDGTYHGPIDLRHVWERNARFEPFERMLWSFYAHHARSVFERMADRPISVGQLLQSRWALARAHYADGSPQRALECMWALRARLPHAKWPDRFLAFEALLLAKNGRAADALARLEGSSAPERHLARFFVRASAGVPAGEALQTLAPLYHEYALAPVASRMPDAALAIDALTAKVQSDERSHGAKISVIMPAYNAAATLGFAARSVLKQSWKNLELVLVDDASTDGTWKTIETLADDARVVALRLPANRGTYGACNAGLSAASGRFVTIHGADDWSHPERLAVQLRYFLDRGVASITYGARVRHDLRTNHPMRYRNPLIANVSSFVCEREVALALNGWEETRFGADTEFIKRHDRYVGRTHDKLLRRVPMAWLLAEERSLTLSSVTGLASLDYGARREHIEAYEDWHIAAPSLRREAVIAYPVPAITVSAKPPAVARDRLLMGDFADGSNVALACTAIDRWTGTGLSVALVHLPEPTSFGQPIAPALRARIRRCALAVVVPGESIRADAALMLGGVPTMLPEPAPTFSIGTVYIASPSGPRAVNAHAALIALLGTEPVPLGDEEGA